MTTIQIILSPGYLCLSNTPFPQTTGTYVSLLSRKLCNMKFGFDFCSQLLAQNYISYNYNFSRVVFFLYSLFLYVHICYFICNRPSLHVGPVELLRTPLLQTCRLKSNDFSFDPNNTRYQCSLPASSHRDI